MPNDWDGLPAPKSCPFCGGVCLVWTPPREFPRRLALFVYCHECNSRGPSATTPEAAVDAWNKRPA